MYSLEPMSNFEFDTDLVEILTTTGTADIAFDTERPLPKQLVEECIRIAVQVPSGANAQDWHFVIVDDQTCKDKLAAVYKKCWDEYLATPNVLSIYKRHINSDNEQLKISQQVEISMAEFLSENMSSLPVLLIPCYRSRSDKLRIVGQATRFGSIYPAIWNFMLAARTCGIASKITTLHLLHEQEAADVLGIPFSEYMQCGLIPLGYAKSPVYKPAYRPPIANVLHYNKW